MLLIGFIGVVVIAILQGVELHRSNTRLNDIEFNRNKILRELDKRRQHTTLVRKDCMIMRDKDGYLPLFVTQHVCENLRKRLLEQVEEGIVMQRTELPDGLKVQASIIIVSPNEALVATNPTESHERDYEICSLQPTGKEPVVLAEP